MSYLYLTIAIVSELIATMTIRTTESFTRLWPSVIVIMSVCSSLYFFSLSHRSLNVAYVYAVWSGIGIAAVSILGWMIYGQCLDPAALVGITLIIAGIVIMNLFSNSVEVPETASAKPTATIPSDGL